MNKDNVVDLIPGMRNLNILDELVETLDDSFISEDDVAELQFLLDELKGLTSEVTEMKKTAQSLYTDDVFTQFD